MIPLSILDLAPIVEGGSARQALANSLDLARHAETWGYHRFWLAEHHNMPGIASAATSVVIGHVAAGTTSIRVGAGGIMLPNHSPLVIAEQFGTLEALFPGRIDLGLGRAPGTDPLTARALRRNLTNDSDGFPDDVQELISHLAPARAEKPVRAVPGAGSRVPVWILGSSLFGAELAARFGLPYAFASHFAPTHLMAALETYRSRFRPSETLAEPRVMLGLNVFAADDEKEAHRLITSLQQAFVNLRRGKPQPLAPPVDDAELDITSAERAQLDQLLACTAIGSAETVHAEIRDFVAATAADELIVVSQIHDHAARLRSYEIVAELIAGD